MRLKLSLVWKLTIAFIVVAVTSVAVVALFIRLTSNDRLVQLIIDQQRSDLTASLTDYYQTNGSWNSIALDWQKLQFSARRSTPPPSPVLEKYSSKYCLVYSNIPTEVLGFTQDFSKKYSTDHW